MRYPDKFNKLLQSLERHQGITVAFSGGVDSTLLLAAARMAHGDNVLAITMQSPYIPAWEIEESDDFCKQHSIRHLKIVTGIPHDIQNNPQNRCYLCKRHLFSIIKQEALKNRLPVVVDGTNADDANVYRPGMTALKELGIISPLLEHGITKAEVREYAGMLQLPVAGKPAYACLLTRLPYDYLVKEEELTRIEAAERYLFSLGYDKSRVRNHGNIARIEIEKEKIFQFISHIDTQQLISHFKELGYLYVTLDLEGFRSGSFDTHIKLKV